MIFTKLETRRSFFPLVTVAWAATTQTRSKIDMLKSHQSETLTLDDYAGMLFPCAERKIPCLCINPDFEKLVGGGFLVQAQLHSFMLVWGAGALDW